MSESDQQMVIIEWAHLQSGQHPELMLLFGTMNGIRLTIGAAKKAKALGMNKGCPDLWLPVPRKGFHGLVIELKDGDNKLTPEQVDWLDALNYYGYNASCCWGAGDAIQCISEYLEMEK
jgi:hypothetical protein